MRINKVVAALATAALVIGSGLHAAQAQASVSHSLFNNTSTGTAKADPDRSSVELGVKFTANTSGKVTSVRFLKVNGDTNKHTVSLWDKHGNRIGEGTSKRESAKGWQTVKLSKAVPLTPNEEYVASFHTTRYMATTGFFKKPHSSGALTAPVNAGVYKYGHTPAFPNQTWDSANYWVDVVFNENSSTTSTTTTPTTTTSSTTSTSTTTAPTTVAPTTTTAAPTTTTTAPNSPGGFQANCIVKPSACGYPDETNTGVPKGIVLKDSGSIRVDKDGAVIDGLHVRGQITVRANNVTIRNTKITSGDYYPIDYYGGHTGLLVEDTEIVGLSHTVTAGLSFNNYTARRVHIHGTADGFKADSNVLIENSYVHSLAVNLAADTHNDGVQTTGGSNVTVRNSTFKLNQHGVSAVMQFGNANSNWLVENNLLDGGGWTINIGSNNSNVRFVNNRFTRNAGYGVGWGPGTTWSGNYYDNDGTPINQ